MGPLMTDGSLRELLVVQMQHVQAEYPGLELVILPDGALTVRGSVLAEPEYDGVKIRGQYELQIEIPPDYPNTPPNARETSGAVPESFHMFPTAHLCLGATVEVKRVFAERRSLLWFIDRQVIPYMYSCKYFSTSGTMPWGELAHGVNGTLDYYNEFLGTKGDVVSLRMLYLLAIGKHADRVPCPCKSNRDLQDCHGPKLKELAPHHPASEFYCELLEMLNLFQRDMRNVVPTCKTATRTAGPLPHGLGAKANNPPASSRASLPDLFLDTRRDRLR